MHVEWYSILIYTSDTRTWLKTLRHFIVSANMQHFQNIVRSNTRTHEIYKKKGSESDVWIVRRMTSPSNTKDTTSLLQIVLLVTNLLFAEQLEHDLGKKVCRCCSIHKHNSLYGGGSLLLQKVWTFPLSSSCSLELQMMP